MAPPPFPVSRPRRLRGNAALRRLVRETSLTPADLIAPLFVKEGIEAAQPVASMPGVVQHTNESLLAEVKELRAAGVAAVLLFGVPSHKDAEGTEAWNDDGMLQQSVRALR